MSNSSKQTCVIVGASHAGVTAAFALRNQGWQGRVLLIDSQADLPYHRPPLSKTYLSADEQHAGLPLKPESQYAKHNIELSLGAKVTQLNASSQEITLDAGQVIHYNKLVLATGARAFIPPIKGIEQNSSVLTLRTLADAQAISTLLESHPNAKVVVIGGGYIGLETAASLSKLGANVTILERDPRLLSRVTAPLMSEFFEQLHQAHNVVIHTQKQVSSIETVDGKQHVICDDDSQYDADFVVVGAGIQVNSELAESVNLASKGGIHVNQQARTEDPHIYAIGDCTFHWNEYYQRHIRLESVQNAVEQAKVAAQAICGKQTSYDTLPWFWSDQFDIKLQIVGLSQGFDRVIKRCEKDQPQQFSVWYFQGEKLIAVDAINHTKAYVIGTKLLKSKQQVNLNLLQDEASLLSFQDLCAET